MANVGGDDLMRRDFFVRGALTAGALVMIALSSPLSGSAQPPGGSVGRNPISRPTVSPYLNLLNNGGRNPGLNYFNLVRPEQQFQQANKQFSGELNSLQSSVNGQQRPQQAAAQKTPLVTGRMAPTGHSTTFNQLGGYYPTSLAGSAAAGSRMPRR
ncbi:MAG TPA: hypothetical protein VM165_22800 [Planctomycetaceae bacterium]|nr:hypothetical protein [Planctomycetaceae bacterium]